MRYTTCVLCLVVVAGLAVVQGAEPRRADVADKISQLSFLAGSWSGPMWGGEFRAYYSTPEGGQVLSHSELLQEGRVAFHEFEVFRAKDGEVVLMPHPKGQPVVGFTLAKVEKSRAIFENPKKDFPTRIDYHLKSKDQLVITLSDPAGDPNKVEVFNLRRVAAKDAKKGKTQS